MMRVRLLGLGVRNEEGVKDLAVDFLWSMMMNMMMDEEKKRGVMGR